MRQSKNIIKLILIILLIILLIIVIYFKVPYSPIKNQLKKDFKSLNITDKEAEVEYFTKEDFIHYPIPIQKYIENNGFLGKEKMNYTYMLYKNVDFAQAPGKNITIDYSQYNFANDPNRIAIVESSIFGIPFEGYDYYINGQGGMKGMLAKLLNLFNQQGKEMDKGALSTYLSECLFVPSSLLYNKNISFEEIDPLNVKACIKHKDISVSGIFTFNEKYEMIKFYTEDRPAVKDDGSIDYIPWSANILSYKKNTDGINFIDHVQIIWHYPDKDFIYFDGNINNFIFK